MKSMIPLLCAAALQATTVETLVGRLGHEDPAIRDAATSDLLALGPDIVPALDPFRGDDDPEVAARVEWILARLAPRRLGDLLTVGLRWGDEGLDVAITNGSSSTVVLRDNLLVSALLRDGSAIAFGGVCGGRGCPLREAEFFELAPGQTRTGATLTVGYEEIVGTVRVGYDFSRSAYVARCRRSHAGHDDPAKPWNRAPEISLRREIDVPPPPVD